jgi:hypothetical protein
MSEEYPPRTRPFGRWSDPHTDITGKRAPDADQPPPEPEPDEVEDTTK